jgi:hypothetical protein
MFKFTATFYELLRACTSLGDETYDIHVLWTVKSLEQ